MDFTFYTFALFNKVLHDSSHFVELPTHKKKFDLFFYYISLLSSNRYNSKKNVNLLVISDDWFFFALLKTYLCLLRTTMNGKLWYKSSALFQFSDWLGASNALHWIFTSWRSDVFISLVVVVVGATGLICCAFEDFPTISFGLGKKLLETFESWLVLLERYVWPFVRFFLSSGGRDTTWESIVQIESSSQLIFVGESITRFA